MRDAQNHLTVLVAASPEKAPNYAADTLDVRSADLHTAVVVGKGTVSGAATVDLVFKDPDGIEFVAMITAALLRQVVNVCNHVESQGR